MDITDCLTLLAHMDTQQLTVVPYLYITLEVEQYAVV